MSVLCEWPEQHPTYYITAVVMPGGSLWPMGGTKSLERCRELAKLHGQVVCEIRVIEEDK